LALGVANRVHMLRHAVYSVISPEGCASILMKSASAASQAAELLRITAPDVLRLGVVDSIIDEPEGGAHRSVERTAAFIKERVLADFAELKAMSGEKLRDSRIEKFMKMGFTGDGAEIMGLN
jgi:acetyl-CoA carboxylase carboxyl transferase subunit alpha